ncbi:DUF5709 domain-containing protein [Blastococcus sp. Marseille-P5729]|uniref:DUF5709 domain-containing protein n=1 Tax=Blastococcus sp. Marseille-P5729 TaxID=2086582 RepID=UPI000D0F3FE2|nr:DUF5709 domain-containing protein [Blastococcus sp. Marseille-P5729]
MSSDSEQYGDYSVDDDDQLQPEDTLIDRGVDDALDEGYVPPDRWSPAQGYGNTANEEARGESLDQRLKQEEPDFDPSKDVWNDDDLDDGQVGDRRSGRLIAPDEGSGHDDESAAIASDMGIDGGAASAEEAAMHIVDED